MTIGREVAVARISSATGLLALREEWSELLQASESDGLFLTWEWMQSWWSCLGGHSQLFLLAVRAGPQLIALAPFSLRGASLLRTPPLRCLSMMGSGAVGSDHLDVIVRRGWEEEAARALGDSLARAGELLALTRLREGSAAQAVAATLEQRGWTREPSRGETCPIATRPPGGFAEYLASLGAQHRTTFRRKLGALHRRFAVRFELARTEEERRRALAILIDLHQRRWKSRGQSEAFCSAGLRAFHQELGALALERGWLRLFVLRLDGRPVAALYGFRYGRIFSFYQSGFDPDFAKESVGLVSMGLALESAFDEGAAAFDLLHGDEPYKFHWARDARQLSSIDLYPPGARGVVLQRIAALAKSIRSAGRELLAPGPRESPT